MMDMNLLMDSFIKDGDQKITNCYLAIVKQFNIIGALKGSKFNINDVKLIPAVDNMPWKITIELGDMSASLVTGKVPFLIHKNVPLDEFIESLELDPESKTARKIHASIMDMGSWARMVSINHDQKIRNEGEVELVTVEDTVVVDK